jgi:hypothetical protein
MAGKGGRFKLGKRKSKKMFSRTASKAHKKNFAGSVMRGGIRL